MTTKVKFTVNSTDSLILNFPRSDYAENFVDAVCTFSRPHGVDAQVLRPSLMAATFSAAMVDFFRAMYVETGYNKIAVIKEIRMLTGAGLKEAKDFCDIHFFAQ